MANEQAEFLASFPNTQSAITFHGAGGMRIQLDIPENQIGEAAQLLMWREQVLRVTIVLEEDGGLLGDIELSDVESS